jgi:hypothetical protein
MTPELRNLHRTPKQNSNIVVYLIDQHPLDLAIDEDQFRWLQSDDGYLRELNGIIGPFDPSNLSILKDPRPSGPAWHQLLESLERGEIGTVVTHLAPLTSGQRQQLIGVCAFMGASLVTPGDGGRSSFRIHPPN